MKRLLSISPTAMMIIAFFLLLLGVILPLLMVIHVVKSTFFLNFFSYTISLIGLFIGMYGATQYAARNRKK